MQKEDIDFLDEIIENFLDEYCNKISEDESLKKKAKLDFEKLFEEIEEQIEGMTFKKIEKNEYSIFYFDNEILNLDLSETPYLLGVYYNDSNEYIML